MDKTYFGFFIKKRDFTLKLVEIKAIVLEDWNYILLFDIM